METLGHLKKASQESNHSCSFYKFKHNEFMTFTPGSKCIVLLGFMQQHCQCTKSQFKDMGAKPLSKVERKRQPWPMSHYKLPPVPIFAFRRTAASEQEQEQEQGVLKDSVRPSATATVRAVWHVVALSIYA